MRTGFIGAGRRFTLDIAPVFATFGGEVSQQLVVTRTPRYVEELGFSSSGSLSEVAKDLPGLDLIYVAVPPSATAQILSQLQQHGVGDRHTVVIDTPVFRNIITSESLYSFGQVFVAEDAFFLPWIGPARAWLNAHGGARTVTFYRSGFEYHAVATARALLSECGERLEVKPRLFSRRAERKFRVNGVPVDILGPKDYDEGQIRIIANDGQELRFGNGSQSPGVELLWEKGNLREVRVGNWRNTIEPVEQELILSKEPWEKNAVSLTPDFKRIGLRRLLDGIVKKAAPKGVTPLECYFDSAVLRTLRFPLLSHR